MLESKERQFGVVEIHILARMHTLFKTVPYCRLIIHIA